MIRLDYGFRAPQLQWLCGAHNFTSVLKEKKLTVKIAGKHSCVNMLLSDEHKSADNTVAKSPKGAKRQTEQNYGHMNNNYIKTCKTSTSKQNSTVHISPKKRAKECAIRLCASTRPRNQRQQCIGKLPTDA